VSLFNYGSEKFCFNFRNQWKRRHGSSKDMCMRSFFEHWWYLAVNTTININQSNCSHWFYLIVATCFGPHFGLSSGSLIKYVSYYGTVLIWTHIGATHHNHTIHATGTKLKNFYNFKIFKNLKLFKIPLSLNVKFYVLCFCPAL
jgi:hypothetical protein